MNREPTPKEIERAKEMIRGDVAHDLYEAFGDVPYRLNDLERRWIQRELPKVVTDPKCDNAELGRLVRLAFHRGVNTTIDTEAYDKAKGWQEFGERA